MGMNIKKPSSFENKDGSVLSADLIIIQDTFSIIYFVKCDAGDE